MSTVGELVDRCYREILLPADDQPTITTLTVAVTDSATGWSYDGTVLSADEEELLAPGIVIDAGLEQVAVTDVDYDNNIVTVRRGVNGTTRTAHDAGTVLTPAPTFGRRAVFDAVADNVVALYPSLYRLATDTVTIADGYADAPAGAVTAVGGRYLSGSRYVNVGVSLATGFSDSATGAAVFTDGLRSGALQLTFRARFTRPTSEADILQTLGVDESWERIVLVGAAAQLLAGRELDSVNIEFITEAMRQQAYPVGSAQRQRDGLLRYYTFLLDQARRQLLASNAEVVSMNAAV